MQYLIQNDLLLAWHDRSDGGLFACLSEMAFAGHCGLNIKLDDLSSDSIAVLFNEELGGVIQISTQQKNIINNVFEENGLSNCVHPVAVINSNDQITIDHNGKSLFNASRSDLQSAWSETSFRIQEIRDNPECAREEFDAIQKENKGINTKLSFDINEDTSAPYF